MTPLSKVDEQMDRVTAIDLAIIALDDQQVKHEKNKNLSLALSCHAAREVLERIRDEVWPGVDDDRP